MAFDRVGVSTDLSQSIIPRSTEVFICRLVLVLIPRYITTIDFDCRVQREAVSDNVVRKEKTPDSLEIRRRPDSAGKIRC